MKRKPAASPGREAATGPSERLAGALNDATLNARAAAGLAMALHRLYTLELAESEQVVVCLGGQPSSPEADANHRAARERRTELRGLVPMLAAMEERAHAVEGYVARVAASAGRLTGKGSAK